MYQPGLKRRLAVEGVGSALLAAAVVGSGIMGERLAGGSVAIALLANAVATGAALIALILAFQPVSGAHFNPVVSLSCAWRGSLAWRDVPGYVSLQFLGTAAGVVAAHGMFGEPWISLSTHERSGAAQLWSEFIATFGLVAVVWGCSGPRPSFAPFAVAAYITGAYWFTASTSFANPAITAARCLSNTFAGIRPHDVPGFVVAQLVGAAAGTAFFCWLRPASIDSPPEPDASPLERQELLEKET